MEFFRFSSPPFTRELRIEERFKLAHIEEQVDTLKQTVDERQSGALVAPAGCGKTATLRALCKQLPEARYRVAYIKLADLSARDMCREVALALGLPSAGLYPALVRTIEERLRSGLMDAGIRQLIIFDDAHDLRPEALRLVRLLTNFQMDSRLIVSIILAGQMPLKKKLLSDELEDVRHRLAHCGELRLLSREETRSYIQHRSAIAGLADAPFEKEAIDAIFEISRGNMRAIDKLALASLREANKQQKGRVDACDVARTRGYMWS